MSDEREAQRHTIASLLHVAILMMMVVVAYAIVQRGFFVFQVHLAMLVLLVLIGVRWFLDRLSQRLVSVSLVIGLWLFVNAEYLLFENGLRAPTFLAVTLFLVVYVGLIHGPLGVTVLALASTVVMLTVGILEWCGVFFTEPKIPDTRWSVALAAILIPSTAAMVASALQNLRQSVGMYKQESAKRRQSEEGVIALNRELSRAYDTTLEGWARALELRDKETEGHSRRVTELTVTLAQKLGLTDEQVRYARFGALLHDIGKMGIPDDILGKPAKLTVKERHIVQNHPRLAEVVLADIPYLAQARSVWLYHHENWDGTGYPYGLKGAEIPILARVFSIVDNWDALASDRPYRKAWPESRIRKYMSDQAGKKFDPQVLDTFLSMLA